LGITTIFVTHDQIEALGMGDRIVVMSQGKIVQVGPPKEVYHDSANIFVATFLGSPGMNILEMDEFLVGFRPEQFILNKNGDTKNQLKAFALRVNRVEYLGADQLIYGNVEGYSREYNVVAKFSSESTSDIEANNTYEFVVKRDQLRFFDKDTGLRIEPRSF
jgi:multiple sugar transport system ATP-binding protein